ncbi:hypothetical protein PBRA_009683 [Plasmodiophora brassicae]|uniref:Integrase catalytic domain-containing protein n=1 Tax=Plasmodiophora brassicae TaxID=37360 RepID=A0A0G4IKQ9_PLABS|nr:hypothetical protein PBRA_009683 [Plasmodiophora brassicae]
MAERQATPNTDDDPLRHLSLEEIDTRIAEAEATIARQEMIDRLRVLQQQLARPTSCPSTPAMPIIAEAHSRSDAGRLPMPKFDGTPDSFTSWVQTAALWFRNRGYADVIGINEDGSPNATTGTAHDPALEAAAREILLVHMLDHKIASALSLFQAGSAAKCWRVLFQAYSPSSLASVVRAVRDLVTVQHMPGESVATYAARVQAAVHRVRSTVPTEMLSLTDALVAVLILANASSDLDAVVAGLHNRALDTLPSVSEVVGSLTSEEIRVRCPCEACLLVKGKRSSFPPSKSRALRVGDLVHSDLSGRWPVVGVGGFEYYQTMLDDSSRYLSVYLLRRKSEALDVIKHYDARLRNQEGRGIRTFQTDGGGEYNSKACVLFYNESGILHRKYVPYTPEQNGRAESVNYTLCGIESSIRCHSRMPDSTWPWSLSYSAILYNIHPRSVLPGRRTSFEAARRALPNISALRVYGCDAYAMRPHPATKKPSKLEPRRVRAVFIGFTPGMKAWRFYDVDREDTFESTTAEFLETSFTFGFGRSSPASSSSAPPSSPELSSAPNVDTIVPTPVSSDAVMAPLPSTSASPLAAVKDHVVPPAHGDAVTVRDCVTSTAEAPPLTPLSVTAWQAPVTQRYVATVSRRCRSE